MHAHTEYKANKNATKFRPRQVARVFLRREDGVVGSDAGGVGGVGGAGDATATGGVVHVFFYRSLMVSQVLLLQCSAFPLKA